MSYVTSVKNQRPFNTCWGFAATSAAETSILGQGLVYEDIDASNFDLSEKQLAYFAHTHINDPTSSQDGEGLYSVNEGPSADINNGGAPYLATNTYAMGVGPVLESRGEPYEYMPANHGVTIVGWDDGFKRENFCEGEWADPKTGEAYTRVRPPADGAWLVKNSWGAGTNEFPYRGDGDEAGEEWPDSGTVEKPTQAKLVFECENWETGEGALQDAFPMFDDANVEVVAPGAATKAMPAKASSAKTGDFSPLAIAGIALVALIAACGIALSLTRRRS